MNTFFTCKFRPEVNIKEVISEAFEYENGLYTLKSEMNEYICVNEYDRSIEEYGYDGLVMSWIDAGYIQGYESKEERQQRTMVFPQTIGNITFYTAQELIEWVTIKQQ